MHVITIDSPLGHILNKKTEEIHLSEFPLAKDIGENLFLAIKPHMPAAGLSAPQIGVSKSIFIYSFDRSLENMQVVINSQFEPVNDTKIAGWEGCLSVTLSNGIFKIAKIPRFQTIKVSFLTLEGKRHEKTLDGFAAKVFQHEYDHLLGIVNIYRDDAEVKAFDTREEMLHFMQQVKKEDSAQYNKPL